MSVDFDTCSNCGQSLLKGAMRCTKCGKIVKTPEEQAASIQKLKASKKSFDIVRLFKFIILLVAIFIIYHFFSGQISELISRMLGKLSNT